MIWTTQAGPAGVLGGIACGTSTDLEPIYAAITKGSHETYTYPTYDGQKKTATGGLWTALDAATGKNLWQTAARQSPGYTIDGFVSSANDMVCAGAVPQNRRQRYQVTDGDG